MDVCVAHIRRRVDHAFKRGQADPVVGGERILIEARDRRGKSQAAEDRGGNAESDQAHALIVAPWPETEDRNEKRGEQKFKRQAKCRSERDPDEPASAQVDEGHSRADPRLMILARNKVNKQRQAPRSAIILLLTPHLDPLQFPIFLTTRFSHAAYPVIRQFSDH